MTDLKPAPKQLAWLAAEARGGEWTYKATADALLACSNANWPAERIYRETFRLLLVADSGPDDLRKLAAKPTIGSAGPEISARGKARVMRALEQTEGYQERLARESAAAPQEGDVA